jgi:hypothetical protein
MAMAYRECIMSENAYSAPKWSSNTHDDDLTSCFITTVFSAHPRRDGNAAQVKELILEATATLDRTLIPQ